MRRQTTPPRQNRVQREAIIRRIEELHAECVRIYSQDLTRVRALAEEALALARSIGHKSWIAESHLKISFSYQYTGDHQTGQCHLQQATTLFRTLKNRSRLADAWMAQAWQWLETGKYSEALKIYKKTLRLYRSLPSRLGPLRSLHGIGNAYSNRGDYPAALEAYAELLREAEAAGHKGLMGAAYHDIGVVHQRTGRLEEASRYFTKAYDTWQGLGLDHQRSLLLQNMAMLHIELGNYDVAKSYTAELRSLARQLESVWREGIALEIIGEIDEKKGEFDAALRCYHKALKIQTRYDHKGHIAHLHYKMSRTLDAKRRYANAIAHAEQALQLAEALPEIPLQDKLYRHLAALHEKRRDSVTALSYYKKYLSFREKVWHEEREKNLLELEERFTKEHLEREKESERRRADRLQQQVDGKNRELAALAMQMAEKSAQLAKLIGEIEALTSASPKRTSTIVQQLRSVADTDADWDTFAQRFQTLYPDYQSRIRKRYPSLTPTELKVCSLLMVGLATKEIATLLHTSVRTVENQRNSIRRKIALPPRVSLTSFLATI